MEIAIGLGIGQGFQPISSFNYGAGLYSRVREAYKDAFRVISILIIVLSVIVFIFSPEIVYALRHDAEVVAIGTRALRLQSVAIVALPFCMITEMLLQTTGNKAAASFLSSARGGLLFIPTLIILAKLRGLAGIQEAQPVAYIISILPSYIMNRRFFNNLPEDNK